MTPMFHEGENNRLGAHAARPEPVSESSSRLAVLVRAPEGFALHREPPPGVVPVPAHVRRGPGVQRQDGVGLIEFSRQFELGIQVLQASLGGRQALGYFLDLAFILGLLGEFPMGDRVLQ